MIPSIQAFKERCIQAVSKPRKLVLIAIAVTGVGLSIFSADNMYKKSYTSCLDGDRHICKVESLIKAACACAVGLMIDIAVVAGCHLVLKCSHEVVVITDEENV